MTHLKLAVMTASLLTLTALGADELFLAPPQHAAPPLAQHAVTNRAFQGISSLAVSPQGRLWAVWYAGVTPGEDHNNYVAVSTSGDNGRTWKEVLVVDPDSTGPVRAFDPELWLAPDGKLRLFWAQSIAHPPARFFISRLASGNLLLVKHGPIDKKIGRSHLTAYISTDDGKSWGGGLLLDERSGVSYPDGQQTSDGTIYITYDYNRTSDRNQDSVAEALLKQGFQKVSLPEVRLFDPGNPRNYCTLYQKACAVGEIVTFGKWAVPLCFEK